MKNLKRIVIFGLVFSLLAPSLAGCVQSPESRWCFDENENFAQISAYTENMMGTYVFEAGEEYPVFNDTLTVDDVVIFDYTQLEANSGADPLDLESLTYDDVVKFSVTPDAFEASEGGTGFYATFTSDTDDTFYALVNKSASEFGKYTWIISEEMLAENSVSSAVLFSEFVDTYEDVWDTCKSSIKIVTTVASCMKNFQKDNFMGFISGLSSILDVISGLSFGSSEDTMKETVKSIDKKIDTLTTALNNDYAQMNTDIIRSQVGIDQSIITTLKGQMNDFFDTYISKVDEYSLNIQNAESDFLKDYINQDHAITVYYNADSDGNLVPVTENEFDNTGMSFIYELGSFTESKKFLKTSNNVVKDGFLDSLYDDILENIKSTDSAPGRAQEDVVRDVYDVIIEEFYRNYFSDNKALATEMENFALKFSDFISDKKGATSVLSTYRDSLKYTYNFAGECKELYVGACANVSSLLGKMCALAQSACYYNEIDTDKLEDSYEDAIAKIKEYKDSVYQLDDNYNFVTENVSEATLVGNYYNVLSKDNLVELRLKTLEMTQDTDISTLLSSVPSTADPSNQINLSSYSVYDVSSIERMYARYTMLYKSGLTDSKDFYSYLLKLGVVKKSADDTYGYLKNNGTIVESIRFMSALNTRELTADDSLNMLCIGNANEDTLGPVEYIMDYMPGTVYKFKGSHEKKDWTGEMAYATYFYMDGSKKVDEYTCSGAKYKLTLHQGWTKTQDWYQGFTTGGSYTFIMYAK